MQPSCSNKDRSDPLTQGPPICICGDCHIGNLGPVACAGGELAIEIRDFDQTVTGHASNSRHYHDRNVPP
ncbi:MAG TPA: DUF2252 family protein [Acetobacteraceae bacterium]|nr:DUF2252 family protein [Acetobacteraceae bacterium]